jgi:alkylhydroperoxidase family enzyme
VAKLLHEIAWEKPLFDLLARPDPELMKPLSPWVAEVARTLGTRETTVYASPDHVAIAYFVACQENECRFCYGSTRALMRIWGYSERTIRDLEHEASLADGTTRRVVEFARKLAKSNPSPARQDYEEMTREGLAPEAVSELAGCIVKACFSNRLSTFLALPPDPIEKMAGGFVSRLLWGGVKKMTLPQKVSPPARFANDGPCAAIIAIAGHTPIGLWLRALTDGWVASTVLALRTRVLMLAVVARQLGSPLCEEEARADLLRQGLAGDEVDEVLSTLASGDELETRLLRWTRETIWYEPREIQRSTRVLLECTDPATTTEAVGSAAVCNTLARLSLVRQ